jgi:hypothetical protein
MQVHILFVHSVKYNVPRLTCLVPDISSQDKKNSKSGLKLINNQQSLR